MHQLSKPEIIKFQEFLQNKEKEIYSSVVDRFGQDKAIIMRIFIPQVVKTYLTLIEQYQEQKPFEMPEFSFIKASKRFLIQIQFPEHALSIGTDIACGDQEIDELNNLFVNRIDQFDQTLSSENRSDINLLKNCVEEFASELSRK